MEVRIYSEPDLDPDLSFIGEYGDRPHADRRLSVDVWASEYGHIADDIWKRQPNCYRWFNPSYGHGCYTEGLSLERLMQSYAECMGSRDEAYRQIMRERMQDYRRMQDFGNGWYMLMVTAEVSKAGIVLATASIGGVESDGYDDDESCANEHGLIDDALARANDKLKELAQ